MSDVPPLTSEEATAWFTKRIPDSWFTSTRVLVDRDEIMVIGELDTTEDDDLDDAIDEFREATRDERIAIAAKAESRYGRKVSWACGADDRHVVFTHLSVPVMTRLRLPERSILDTLVGAGAARSRSDAVAWCVRLVAEHESEWLQELKDAISEVERIRDKRR